MSNVTSVSTHTAASEVKAWVQQFLSDEASKIRFIPEIGKLKKEPAGTISFVQDPLILSLPSVEAKKIIRTDAVHQVLVGDREHSSEYMNEVLHKPAHVLPVSNAWIVALLLFIISLAVITFYGFHRTPQDNPAGNMQKVEVQESRDTYRSSP